MNINLFVMFSQEKMVLCYSHKCTRACCSLQREIILITCRLSKGHVNGKTQK